MNTRRPGRPAAGVTLVEILIAVVVLALGLSTILQIFPLSATASARSRHKIVAMELAQEKLDQIRTNCQMYYDTPTSVTQLYPLASPTAWAAFPSPNDKYWYRVSTAPLLPKNLADPANTQQSFYTDPPTNTKKADIYTEVSGLRYTVDVVGPATTGPGGAPPTSAVTLAAFCANRHLGQLTLMETIDAGDLARPDQGGPGHVGSGYLFQMVNPTDTHAQNFTRFNEAVLNQAITSPTIGPPTGWPIPPNSGSNGLLENYRLFASNVILEDTNNGDKGIYKIDRVTPVPGQSNQFYIHFYDPTPGHTDKNYAPFPQYSSQGLTNGEYSLPAPAYPASPNYYRSYLDPVNSFANPTASAFIPTETQGTGGDHARFNSGAILRSFIVIGTQ